MKKHAIRCALALLTVLVSSACVPADTTFVLTNTSDTDVFRTQFDWMTLLADGEPVTMAPPDCIPRCRAITGSVACSGAMIPTVVRMQPGEMLEQDWDGTYYRVGKNGQCYRKTHRRANFTARYCYSHAYKKTGADNGPASDGGGATIQDTVLDNPTCNEVAVDRGTTVELTAE